MVVSPIPVVLANLWGLLRKTGLHPRLFHTFGAPILCGATVFLWVRVFYSYFLGVCGSQWGAVLLAAGGALVLYLGLLHLLGVHVRGYISSRLARPAAHGLFSFL